MNLLDRLLHRRKDEAVSENTWLVVGLGNPGAQYAGNRHNVGQMVADELASRIGASFKSHKTPSRVAEGFLGPGRPKLVLAKPNSYMNTSGGPVSALLKFYSLGVDRLIVVHDELDIPFDTVRLKRGGGHGGHNGLRDIQKAAGSPEFTRVRVGIGRPPGRMDAADFVLRDFAGAERDALPSLLSDAADAVEAVVELGLVAAQQRFHSPA
ncbi:aminoacyl-tRNA hydrolase [Agromyces aurantiacus]|uniref:Peptidyl-tRNA hydrolase n=1 Tax=Agromyces aurantiacus TaxID=165814 RepID=A0ABV9R986_9MICO|nr:aminoacyl-tRNA hydrolase [Agromyces aurantiacus]MBM7505417.1 PTH1 family peptidyl-tRNA hydrolase [Agromyces aurantiacus]